ncbi:hypothetical protein DM01DRAFT_1322887 [Hesseltinella vesiculosa]|uniref:HCP-like protein n=1 Tax=Hesseltinella vesiculosa TaxID=101127 RepID=A0A1X2GGD9_9FUNG|nr:hypothetical protein DM01DRAFT_1322887 [Hesseltinella vesiculosa]
MFKRIQQKPSKTSFQIVTPNSRNIPSMSDNGEFHAMTMPESAVGMAYDPSSIYDTYDQYDIAQVSQQQQPKITIQNSGTSRQTFIEPLKSTLVTSPVTPQSMYGAPEPMPNVGNMNFFQSASEVDAMSDQYSRPSTIIQPRVQRAEMAVKMGQVQQPLQASHASIEQTPHGQTHHDYRLMDNAVASKYFLPSDAMASYPSAYDTSNKSSKYFLPSDAMASLPSAYDTSNKSSKYFMPANEAYSTKSDQPPLPSIVTPSKSTHSTHSSSSSSSNKSSSRHHPQPLPPLVIPPTPNRSSSSPNRAIQTSSKTLSPPALQMTPGLTPGSLGYSPMSVSPATPSPSQHHHGHRSKIAAPSAAAPAMTPTVSSPTNNTQQVLLGKDKKPLSEDEMLLLEGIRFHESGKLEEATHRFRKAAQLNSPMAMFFYGVSLRHGWGCQRNEQVAFQYIQKAAEHAVEDLSQFSTTVSMSAAKGELIMAIYEMGVSFRHGWGCRKNKETAVYFFKIAADLGDPDAQNDLGHCYYNGHGIKKDMYMAAKYYRKADKQGHGIMGNSWIWKPKYDHPKGR